MPSYQKILILCCQQHHSFHLSLGEVRSKAGNDLLSLLQSRLGATEGQVNNPVTWWRFELASLSYFSGWFFLWDLPIHSSIHANTQQVNFSSTYWTYGERDQINQTTAQHRQPYLLWTHSTALQYIQHFPLLFLPVQEDSECCNTLSYPLQMYRPAVAVRAGTRETAQAQNTGCSYLLRLGQLVRDMDEHTNEYMNGGMNRGQERLGQRKRTRQETRHKTQK